MTSHIPQSNGRWSDPSRPGDSLWFPDMTSVPSGSNDPDRPMSFRKLVILHFARPLNLNVSVLKKAAFKINLLALARGAVGVRFRNNEPLFSPFTIATVKLKSLLTERYGGEGTMPAADKLLAERLGIPEQKLRQWINDHQFVWHERQDGRRIDLLPHDIHGNIPHSGGISANRQRV